MKTSGIPPDRWFISTPEALQRLNLIASEIRMRASGDRMLSDLASRMLTTHVLVDDEGGKRRYKFHLELDRGRSNKGYLYVIIEGPGSALRLWQAGTSNYAYLPVVLLDLCGHHLLTAIREILVEDIIDK